MRIVSFKVAVITNPLSEEGEEAASLVQEGKLDFIQLHGIPYAKVPEKFLNLPHYFAITDKMGDLENLSHELKDLGQARFIQDSGFTRSTAEIAEAFGMPEEGLLCTLKQNGIIVEIGDDEEDGWEMAEALKDRGLTMVKTGADGKPENQWTYKGGYFVWLLLTKDCKIRPCYERISHG